MAMVMAPMVPSVPMPIPVTIVMVVLDNVWRIIVVVMPPLSSRWRMSVSIAKIIMLVAVPARPLLTLSGFNWRRRQARE